MTEIKVLLADDHGIIRSGLRALLQSQQDISIVGEAGDGRQAVELVKELQPDVIIMDVAMPGLNGIDAARLARAAKPDLKIIALSANSEERTTAEMLRAGAVGYVAKEAAYEELLEAIHTVMRGLVYFSPAAMSSLVHSVGTDRTPMLETVFGRLSTREREILQLIAEGKSTKQIASTLAISIKTAETHRRNLMEKLQLDTVAELTKYAIREGLTSA